MYIPVWIRHIGSDKHHSKGKVCFDVPPGDEKPIFPKWGLSLQIGPPAGPLGYSLAGVFPSCLFLCVSAVFHTCVVHARCGGGVARRPNNIAPICASPRSAALPMGARKIKNIFIFYFSLGFFGAHVSRHYLVANPPLSVVRVV